VALRSGVAHSTVLFLKIICNRDILVTITECIIITRRLRHIMWPQMTQSAISDLNVFEFLMEC